jgi:hypothetical protein
VILVVAGKSLKERLAETQQKIQQYEAREQNIKQQLRQEERKERTRRLIQIGGILAKLGVDTIEKAQALQQEIQRRPDAQDWLRKVTERAVHQQVPETVAD